MSRSRRVLAIGGKQRILEFGHGLHRDDFIVFRFTLKDKNNIYVESIQNDDNSEINTCV